jgi:transposase
MADRDTDSSDVLQRAEQAQAQSKALREQVARTAEAVAETEQEVARVHRKLADQGGPLAAEAREHADRAEDIAAKERAEAARLRRAEPGSDVD